MTTGAAEDTANDPVIQLVTFHLANETYVVVDLNRLLTEDEWNEVGMC